MIVSLSNLPNLGVGQVAMTCLPQKHRRRRDGEFSLEIPSFQNSHF